MAVSDSEHTSRTIREQVVGIFNPELRNEWLTSTRPDDVVIVTAPKSGTTWAQQICHQLRTGGDQTFEEIDMVIPFVPYAQSIAKPALDLNVDQPYRPRMFKSHDYKEFAPKSCKYIVVIRNPTDTVYSGYKFVNDLYSPDRRLCPETYFATLLDDQTDEKAKVYFYHNPWRFLLSWWPCRFEPNVLWIHYEHLKQDFRGQLNRFARFLNVELTENLASIVENFSSFDYMLLNKSKFDDSFTSSKVFAEVSATNHFNDNSYWSQERVGKVRREGGTSGQGSKHMPMSVLMRMEEIWATEVAPVTGCGNYDEMLERMKMMT